VSSKETTRPENRTSLRAKVTRKLRVRPSDPDIEHFEETLVSTNVSKYGIYFETPLDSYRVGMRLFVTYPFTFENDPLKTEYIAEVLRVEQFPDSKFGIAIRLITTI
jgi:hypothetical protein